MITHEKIFPILNSCALIVLMFLVIPSLSAQETNYKWVEKNNGLTSWNVVGVEVDHQNPATVYVLTRHHGVYKSTNSGNTWVQKMQGVPVDAEPMWAHLCGNLLTMDHDDSNILYTNFDGEVFITTDGAENWVNINDGIDGCPDNFQVAGVKIDPQNTNHIFAAHIASQCNGGLFESFNRGITWTQIAGYNMPSNPPMGNDAWAIAIDPTDDQRIYSSTVYIPFMYSLDGGFTWTENSPPSAGADGTVIVVHPDFPSRLILGHSTGLHVSTDYGLNWTDLTSQVNGYVYDINVAHSDSSVLYAVTYEGLFKSTDGGLNWTEVGEYCDLSLMSVAIHPTNTGIIFVTSSGNGVFRSTNGGVSFTEMNEGIPMTINISAATVAPSDPNVYYAAIYGRGFYRSSDMAESWTLLDNNNNLTKTMFITVDPFDADTLYAGFDEIVVSTDGGATWSSTALILDHTFTDLTIDPTDSSCLYTVTSPYPDLNRVYKSLDAGASWQNTVSYSSRVSRPIVIDSINPSNVYIASYYYLKKSTDAGINWTIISAGLTENSYDKMLDGLAVDPVENNIVYVTTRSDRIFKSTDYGISFFELCELGSYPGKIIIDQENHMRLYVFSLYSWYRSDDGGYTWNELSTEGLMSSVKKLSTTAFQDPLDPTRFVTGDYYQGILIGRNYVPDFTSSLLSVTPDQDVTLGTVLTFSNQVVNSGLQAGENMKLLVTVHDGCSYIDNSLTVDGMAAPEIWVGETLEIPLATIDVDQTVNVQYQFQVIECIEISHSSLITSDDDIYVQDTYTNTVTVLATCYPDYGQSFIDFFDLDGRSLMVSDTLGLRFQLTNVGLIDATNAIFTSLIPSVTSYVPGSARINGEMPAFEPYNNGILTLELGDVPMNSDPIEVSYLVIVDLCEQIIHDVAIYSDEDAGGFVFSNLESEVFCPDLSNSDMDVVDDNGGQAQANDTLTYTLTLPNSNPSHAHYVKVFIVIPDELTYVDNSFQDGGVPVTPDPEANGVIIHTLPVLEGGTTAVLSYQTVIKPDTESGTIIMSSALVSSWENIAGQVVGPVSVIVNNAKTIIHPGSFRPSARIAGSAWNK